MGIRFEFSSHWMHVTSFSMITLNAIWFASSAKNYCQFVEPLSCNREVLRGRTSNIWQSFRSRALFADFSLEYILWPCKNRTNEIWLVSYMRILNCGKGRCYTEPCLYSIIRASSRLHINCVHVRSAFSSVCTHFCEGAFRSHLAPTAVHDLSAICEKQSVEPASSLQLTYSQM